jgi:hypothetical protein
MKLSIEQEDPNLDKLALRMDTADPRLINSQIDKREPSLDIERDENDDERCAKSKTDRLNTEPHAHKPANEALLPSRTYDLTDNADESVLKLSTLTLQLVFVDCRMERFEPRVANVSTDKAPVMFARLFRPVKTLRALPTLANALKESVEPTLMKLNMEIFAPYFPACRIDTQDPHEAKFRTLIASREANFTAP